MLNIISLSVYREKTTGPGKVVKNLIKGLDILGYPYVINHKLDSASRLWIHDDTKALFGLSSISKKTNVIIGPNLYNLGGIPENLQLDSTPYIMPCQWIVDFWKKYGYKGILDVWPVGIDTDIFSEYGNKKEEVLVYVKKRFPEEKNFICSLLEGKGIRYNYIEYGKYSEADFRVALGKTKYAIWIGCPETQGIALGEILSSNIPILLWDVQFLGQWFPGDSRETTVFTEEQKKFSPVTSAPYFDNNCGKRVFQESEIPGAIDFMETNLHTFTPRKYILENLSLAKQARDFLELYNIHYGLSFEDGMKERQGLSYRPFHYSWIWKSIFFLYDSKWFQKYYNLLFK